MANHKSARKRIRQTMRRKQVNKHVQSGLRTLEKKLRQAIEQKDKSKAGGLLKTFNREMDRSNHKIGTHKNKINRKKSQLTLLVNNIH